MMTSNDATSGQRDSCDGFQRHEYRRPPAVAGECDGTSLYLVRRRLTDEERGAVFDFLDRSQKVRETFRNLMHQCRVRDQSPLLRQQPRLRNSHQRALSDAAADNTCRHAKMRYWDGGSEATTQDAQAESSTAQITVLVSGVHNRDLHCTAYWLGSC